MSRFKHAQRALVLGAGSFVYDLLTEISRRPQCGYRIVGIVAREALNEDLCCGYPLLGAVENLHRIILQEKPDVIIVAFPHSSEDLSDHQLLEARVCQHIRIEYAEAVYERLTGKLPIEMFPPRGVIYSDDFEPGRPTLLATRMLSLGCALVGVIIFAPVLLLLALLIKLDSPGPVLFVQERVGFAGKPFRLFKFRTMRPTDQPVSEWEQDNIGRITRVGRWLRKFRLDELPQLFNILRGDMNIVGPRPHPAANFELFVLVSRNTPECGIQIPYYSLRSSVRPGITGWAQVRYHYANNLNEEIEKLRFDLYYLKHYSFWFDVRILFETLKVVFVKPDVVDNTDTALAAAGRLSTPKESTPKVSAPKESAPKVSAPKVVHVSVPIQTDRNPNKNAAPGLNAKP